jgi:hypothetical protein
MAFAGLAVLVGLLLFARSMSRDFDLDEHQFTAPPALLVQDHALPYVDYPYFHMPNLIYLYTSLTAWCPYKLLAARTLSVLCGTATVLLLFAVGWRALAGTAEATRWAVAGGIALTFACSRLFTYTSGWAWNHDTAVVCALGAFLLHVRGLSRARLGYLAVAGFMVGMAIGIRLSFALAVVPLGLSVCLSRSSLTGRQRLAGLALGVLGATLALLPAVAHLAATPDRFFFGNLGYARLNTVFYQSEEDSQPLTPAAKLRFLASVFLSDPGNAALLALFGFALWSLLRRGRAWAAPCRTPLLMLLGLLPALWVGTLGPSPSQYQYHYQVLPFLALAVLYAVAADRADQAALRRWTRLVLAAAVVTSVTGLPRWYWPAVRLFSPERWTTVALHRTGQWVRDHTAPGARVLTIEPLVPLEGGVEVYPDYAVGRFIMHVGRHMTAAERHHFGMAWGEELDALLSRRPPDAILCSRRLFRLSWKLERYAQDNGFVGFDTPDESYQLWVRPAELPAKTRAGVGP